MRFGLAFCLLFFFAQYASAQDPSRFAEEVNGFAGTEGNYAAEHRILFTGSSSIRLWVDFKSYFPDHNVINTGFGGSETSDLIHFKKELITNFKPEQVFIYEGDNDINAEEDPVVVLAEISSLVIDLIKKDGIENLVLISAKPSIARWHLKESYKKFNAGLERLASLSDLITYADVWTPMLNKDGSLKKEIFIEDGLHMNKMGYDLWIKEIEPLLISK
ncbi:GDSL-type esterase/lipase family protein [Roseivirga sp.]|uniref:GDSL-type esterase/lipase family protein n=1 Tax=Roseivirga sp. TaxID=1964215 RepID=UPI003B8B9C5F